MENPQVIHQDADLHDHQLPSNVNVMPDLLSDGCWNVLKGAPSDSGRQLYHKASTLQTPSQNAFHPRGPACWRGVGENETVLH